MTDENLTNGIKAAQAGEHKLARASLMKAVQLDPGSQAGWLWLGHVLEEPERRRYCYQRVLALNPASIEAWNGLDMLSNSQAESKAPAPAILASTPVAPVAAPLPGHKQRQQTSKPKSRSRNQIHIWPGLLFGFMLSLILIALPLGFLILHGDLDAYLLPQNDAYLPTQNMTALPPAMPPVYEHRVNKFITPTSAPTPAGSYSDRLDKANPLTLKALGLLASGKCVEALPLLDQAVLLVPENDKAYYERAFCTISLFDYHFDYHLSFDEKRANLYAGLADIDRAIALRPSRGDYYAVRGLFYWQLAQLEELTVDRNALYATALDNLQTAKILGITLNYPLEVISISALEESGKCGQALKRAQAFLNVSKPATSDYTYVQLMEVRAYACLGELDIAISTLHDMMDQGSVSNEQKMLEAIILYQQHHPDDAFQILEKLVMKMPDEYNGEGYYLRGLILYEKGDRRDQALNSLEFGGHSAWVHGGLYSYMQFRMGLELPGEQNYANALNALQYAEASLSPVFHVLRERLQTEMRNRGIPQLDPPLSVPAVTPVPAFVLRPTARPSLTPTFFVMPTLTPTSQATASANATLGTVPALGTVTPTASPTLSPNPSNTAPGLVYTPPDLNQTVVDMQVGSGPVILTNGERQVLRFQPATAISIQQVQSLTLFLETNESAAPPLLDLWNPFTGTWTALEPKWGETLVRYPGDYVLPEGDIYIALRSPTARLELKNFWLHLVIMDQNGQLTVYGRR